MTSWLIIVIPALLVIFIACWIVGGKSDSDYEKSIVPTVHFDNEEWPSMQDYREEKYKNLVAFWLQRFQENTETLTHILKVKTFLFDEYEWLINSRRNLETRLISFNDREYSNVIPFVGDDDFYYAICFEKWYLSEGTYHITLVPYAKDKFLNNKAMPIKYDGMVLPVNFIGNNWMIKPYYLDAEVYST